jgi:hypothetical protein
MSIQDSPVLRQWPELPGRAVGQYTDMGQGVLIVEASYPSEVEINEAVERALERAERDYFRGLHERAPAVVAEHRANLERFEECLVERWGKALDLFETILIYAQGFGSVFANKYQAQAEKDNDTLFTVLVSLHARACLVASEVLALLRSGHAAGAQTRWRTLHEIASVAYFMRRFGQRVAELYLEHEHIEAYRAAKEY